MGSTFLLSLGFASHSAFYSGHIRSMSGHNDAKTLSPSRDNRSFINEYVCKSGSDADDDDDDSDTDVATIIQTKDRPIGNVTASKETTRKDDTGEMIESSAEDEIVCPI